jgi:hypothetical protein
VFIAGCTGDPARPGGEGGGDSRYAAWQLIDVSDTSGLSGFVHETGADGRLLFPETMGSGVGVIDYDLDEWPDVVLVRGGTWDDRDIPALALYRNTGRSDFVDVTEDVGLDHTSAYGMGLAIGDYDNDGDPDIFLSAVGTNRLFRNDGNRFSEVGLAAGLADRSGWSTSALWFDADLDGWLDLFVGRYVVWSPEEDLFCSVDGRAKAYCTPESYEAEAGLFYHNEGDGTFADWTHRAGFDASPGKTLGVATLDVNGDAWPDLVVTNDTEADELYLNNRDGTFSERGVLSGMAFDENGRPRAGMGVDAGVVDTSGEPSIFVGNFAREMLGVYRHAGDGAFVDRSALSKIGWPSLNTLTFGVVLLDADLDGDLDVFTANGHITEQVDAQGDGIRFRQSPHLFLNDGRGVFADAAGRIPALQKTGVGRGVAVLDFDRDGDQDVLLTENGGPVHLFENTAADLGRKYVKVRVSGRESNRSGYGTRLVAVVNGARQYRSIRSGSSYLSASEAAAVFGLGSSGSVSELIVRWPGGATDTLHNLNVDTELKLVEGNAPLPWN